jgi:hypothetical protein
MSGSRCSSLIKGAARMAKVSPKSCITFVVILDVSFVDAQDLADKGIRADRNDIFP